MGAGEAELGAATRSFGCLHSGPRGGRAPGRGRPELTGCLRVESASPSNLSEGARGRAQEGSGALEGAPLAMGEVEISARAYVKMSLHAARYPHAAVNGLLLAPAPAPRSGECLCLTDCVPLFHSHLALSVMLEVALNQVPPPDAHRPPRNPLTPLAQAHPWSLGSSAHPQGGRQDLVTDGPFPMAGGCVGRAGRAGSGRVLPCQCSFGRPEVSGVARGRRLRVMGWGV